MIEQRVPRGIPPRFFLAGGNPTAWRHDLSDGFASADHGVSLPALHVRENAVRAAGEILGRDRLVPGGNPSSFRPFFATWRPIPSLPDRVLLQGSGCARHGSPRGLAGGGPPSRPSSGRGSGDWPCLWVLRDGRARLFR